MRSCISINLKKDQIVIKIAEDAEQKSIIAALKRKLPELKKLYKDEKTPIKIIGKVLKNKEIDEIQELIKSSIDVDIDFDMPKSLGLSSITRTFKQEIAVSETKFHKGSLRSGQKLETEGSIVILGDVNSGAEVIASDNIVVSSSSGSCGTTCSASSSSCLCIKATSTSSVTCSLTLFR